MADDYDTDIDNSSEVSDNGSDIDTSTEVTETPTDIEEDCNLGDDGSEELLGGDDDDSEEFSKENDENRNNTLEDDTDGDVNEKKDLTDNATDETTETSDNLTDNDGSKKLPDDMLDSSVIDDNGDLRVMNNEEYLTLSPEQQDLFEQKYNSLSQEEKDIYDRQFAQADLQNYNNHIDNGDYDRDENIERDLNDIIDGQYQGNDNYESNVCELCAKGAMSTIGSLMGADPITKTDLARQAGDIGRIYGPNVMESISRTAYVQSGPHIPTPIVSEDKNGNKTYDYGQNELFSKQHNDISEIKTLKTGYADDLINRSEYPETIDKTILDGQWSKIPPEQNEIMREDFGKNKNFLIEQWETENNCKWPTYQDDVYSQNGKLIRRAGDKYDAHHIQPLTFGGENMSSNLTPLHALEHFDKQGIHSPDSPFGKIEKYYKEN